MTPTPRNFHRAINHADTLVVQVRTLGWGPWSWATLGRYAWQADHGLPSRPRDAAELATATAYFREGDFPGYLNRSMRRALERLELTQGEGECACGCPA